MSERTRAASRPLVLIFALAFLLEIWVWDHMVAAVAWIAARIPWDAFKTRARAFINRCPAIVAVLLFGVPVVVSEVGAFFSVVLIALGHVILGATIYIGLKVIGVGLIAVVFDLSREKLMTLPWFVVLHDKFEKLHSYLLGFVQPYRLAALEVLGALRLRALSVWRRWAEPAPSPRIRRLAPLRRGGSCPRFAFLSPQQAPTTTATRRCVGGGQDLLPFWDI